MLTKVSRVLSVFVFILLGAQADAHPQLRNSNPSANAVITESPKEIRIRFSEPVLIQFSAIELTDQGGKKAPTGSAATDLTDQKQLVAPIQGQLAPGTYKVTWRAVSADTHKTGGSYSFELKP